MFHTPYCATLKKKLREGKSFLNELKKKMILYTACFLLLINLGEIIPYTVCDTRLVWLEFMKIGIIVLRFRKNSPLDGQWRSMAAADTGGQSVGR
jgi:hypothetical protein